MAAIGLVAIVTAGSVLWFFMDRDYHEEGPDRDGGAFLGMDHSEYSVVIEEGMRFDIMEYSFYEEKDGDNVLVRFDLATNTIDELRTYPANTIDNSKENFSKIKEGMTVYEVVSLVGVPHRTNTSGMLTMVFDADDGTEYCIYFDIDHSDSTPLSVSKIIML